MLVGKELLSPEWAERVGKYMVRPVPSLERLSFLDREGKVGYRHGPNGAECETEGRSSLVWPLSRPSGPLIHSGRGPGLARGSTSAVLARGYKPRASGEPKARPLTRRSSGPLDLEFLTPVRGRDILIL